MTLPPSAPRHVPSGGEQASAPSSHREVAVVFVVLAVLAALELLVVRATHVAREPRIVALVALAAAKGALVILFFMHLRYETRILRLTVLVPFLAPVLYAAALVADAAWRSSP